MQALLAALHSALEAKLMGANQSRTFYTQSVLPGVHFDTPAPPAPAAAAVAAAAVAAAAASSTAAQSSSSSKAAAAAGARKRARSSTSTAATTSATGSASGSDSEGGGDAPWQPFDIDDDNDVSAKQFCRLYHCVNHVCSGSTCIAAWLRAACRLCAPVSCVPGRVCRVALNFSLQPLSPPQFCHRSGPLSAYYSCDADMLTKRVVILTA
jgi:hypothetical protein